MEGPSLKTFKRQKQGEEVEFVHKETLIVGLISSFLQLWKHLYWTCSCKYIPSNYP